MTSPGTSIVLVQPTDAQLVAASRFDGVHFATVADRHLLGVHGYLARRLGASTADAHLGEALLAAYAARRHFRGWEDSARPWLIGIATNVVRKQWRIEQAQLRALAEPPPVAGSIGRVAADAVADRARSVLDVVDRLPHLAARDRDMVMLAAWEDLPAVAVARALDLPESVVGARLVGADRPGRDRDGSDPARDASPAMGRFVAVVRSLRPTVAGPSEALVETVLGEIAVVTGGVPDRGRLRPTSAIAAEREQLRRWRNGPTARLAARRVGRVG